MTTWKISFEQIREERRSAADLLALMSFFNPQGISESVLRGYARNAAERDDRHKTSVWLKKKFATLRRSSRRDSGKWEEEDIKGGFDDDLDILCAYSLAATTAESDLYEMHPLVQFCTRVWLLSIDLVDWKGDFVDQKRLLDLFGRLTAFMKRFVI